MRLVLSFMPRAGWSLPWLLGALGTVAIILAALLAGMLIDYQRLRSDSQHLAGQLSRSQPLAADTSDQADVSMLQSLLEEASRINRITGVRGRAVPAVLHQIEQVLPESARLRELRYRHRSGDLTLIAELNDAEALSQLLRRLEADDSYEQILLVRQSRGTGVSNGSNLVVELRMTEAGNE